MDFPIKNGYVKLPEGIIPLNRATAAIRHQPFRSILGMLLLAAFEDSREVTVFQNPEGANQCGGTPCLVQALGILPQGGWKVSERSEIGFSSFFSEVSCVKSNGINLIHYDYITLMK